MFFEFISLLFTMAALKIKNLNVIVQFVILVAMTGALAPFSHLVLQYSSFNTTKH
jgi:hypothetical protein